MPELPEVETVVRTLRPILIGSTIESMTFRYAKMIHPTPAIFEKKLNGQSFTNIERIGKFIIFFFSNQSVVVSHLRMEGKFIELKNPLDPLTRFAHLVFHLNDGRRLVYDDMRKFGTFTLTSAKTYLDLPSLKNLGKEPLTPLDPLPILAKINASRRPIKSILLDQRILLGLGNIYADEVLYAAKIHPLKKGTQLTLEETKSMLFHSEKILKAAIASGGSRIRSYRSGSPIDGEFTLNIQAYGREGEPCHRCHHRLDKITVGGRGTHYCPRCQHHPDLPFVIGVTGTIATGKSTLVSVGASLGFHIIDADQIVHRVYQTKPAISFIKLLFPFVVIDQKIDRRQLLKAMIEQPKGYQKLIQWLFPLVKSIILHELMKAKSKAVMIEVPLLFQGNLDAYCDVIIGVDMDASKQKRRLQQRVGDLAEPLWILNERNHYHDFQSYLDVRLTNDGSLTTWQQQAKQALSPFIKYL
jgi:formamidopyrimidine-DNA glycosylase